MPIHQVTHVNHVAPPTDAPPVEPTVPLAALAAAEARLHKKNYFIRNPKLVKQAATELQQKFEWGRNALDVGRRVGQAEEWKAGANLLFADGKSHAALIGYLVGIWYVRPGKPSLPMAIAHAVASAKDDEAEFSTSGIKEFAAWLAAPPDVHAAAAPANAPANAPAASEDGTTAPDEQATAAVALRKSLHLNAAAAALKLSSWAAARAACEVVLAVDETNGKALFRLAKAHEGAGDLKLALSNLITLIKAEPKNREARTLLEAVKARQTDEKAKFKKLFADGSASEGGAAAPPPAADAPAAEPSFRDAYKAHVLERELAPRVYDGVEGSAAEERERQAFHAFGAPDMHSGDAADGAATPAKAKAESTPVTISDPTW